MKALKSLRLHISIFGKTNVGKSSLLNAVTGQSVSIVSDIKGTTTDVVEKSAELFPIGPVAFLDTAGIDDKTELSNERIEKTLNVLNRTDVAVLVITADGLSDYDTGMIEKFGELDIPYLVIINKSDLEKISPEKLAQAQSYTKNVIELSALKTHDITDRFVSALVKLVPEDFVSPKTIAGDLLQPSDVVVLVTPIDKEAPKGRLILPQVQTIRDILDNTCIAVVTQVDNLKYTMEMLKTKPKLVVTDSQAFKEVNEIVPAEIPLTSFSILFARLKGDLVSFRKGANSISSLKQGDKVLILESCTHHAIDDDIARVKIPKLLEKKLGFKPVFEYKTGHDFPDISDYKLIIHCGACMTNRKEVLSRILIANKNNVPITNYGIVISYCLGILERAVAVFEK
ncbi:MAG: [FeFe] hydrogenase H-cluster maturation GTPase HydF [Cyanobacteria bacterium RUI128]|nr:[FeFe] hydrogenase H-cluster maturation GTPase HydF [Cyanobacteria bacterium RUI128]